MTQETESHPRFKTREYWEKEWNAARRLVREIFLSHETRNLSMIEKLDLRRKAADMLNKRFELEAQVSAEWITPLVTDAGLLVGLEITNVEDFFTAIMDKYDG